MPSPFPGMNLYLEDAELWSDFQLSLAVELRSQVNRLIQPLYVAQVKTYETYEFVAVDEAVRELHKVPLKIASIELYRARSRQVVTAIEILAPVNKQPSHDAYHEYQRKRRELLRSAVHLLEVDLLRGGQRPPLVQAVPQAPYYVVLSRAEQRPVVEVWPIQLQQKLPLIPVPLQAPDPDAPLDLSAALAAIYERAGYAIELFLFKRIQVTVTSQLDFHSCKIPWAVTVTFARRYSGTTLMLIDYHQPPPPPKLPEADLLWLDDLLREQEIR